MTLVRSRDRGAIRSRGGGGLRPTVQTFGLVLADLGSGAVDTTTLAFGSGSPTFTRATTAAARLSTGLWNLGVASGTARSHYLPSLVYGGFLAETAATQLLLDPRDMTTANWTAGVTMTAAQTATGMNGSANACTTLTGGAVTATNTILQVVTAAASNRTYSCHIKRRTGTGTIEITQDGGSTWTDVTALIGSSTFLQVKKNQSQLNASMGVRITTNGDQIDVDCNQFEAGSIGTTPIPAGGARNGDLLTFPISGNISSTSGSSYVEATFLSGTSGSNGPIISDTAAARYMPAIQGSTNKGFFDDGTNTVAVTTPIFVVDTVTKVACSWGTTVSNVAVSGTSTTGAFDGSLNLTTLAIGSVVGAFQLNGCIKNIKIYSGPLSAATLATLTT